MRTIFLLTLLLATTLFANVGKVTALKGDVSVVRENKSLALSLNSTILEKDIVKTGEDGRVQLLFNDNTVISIGKKSDFSINEYLFDIQKPKDSKALFNVSKGVFKTITGQIGKLNPEKFKLKTKTATIGIRGTIYFVDVQPGETETYSCTEGSIEIVTPQGSVIVPAGFKVKVEYGKPPSDPIPMTKDEKEQLEQNSGAKENEKESGVDQQAVKKEDEKQEKKEDEKKDSQNDEEKKDDDENDDGTKDEEKQDSDTNDENNDNNDGTDQNDGDTQADADTEGEDPTDPTDGDTETDADTDTETDTEVDTDSADAASDTASDSSTEAADDANEEATTATTTESPKINGEYTFFATATSTPNPSANTLLDNDGNYYNYYYRKQGLVTTDRPTVTIADSKFSIDNYILNKHRPNQSPSTGPTNELTIEILNFDVGTAGSSYTYNSTGVGADYITLGDSSITDSNGKFYYDNMKEFFLYRSDISHPSTDYSSDFTLLFGKKSTTNDDLLTGISKYVDPSSDYNISNKYASTDGSFINWTNKNVLSYEITKDDAFILIGNVTDDGGFRTIPIKFYEVINDYSDTLKEVSSEIYLYGTEYQGWGGEVLVKDSDDYYTYYTHGEFRDTSYTSSSTTPTGKSTFSGFINANKNSANGTAFNLVVDRSNEITSSFSILGYSVSINGTLGTTASYITDDTFATLGFKLDTNEVDGWLLAVDTGNTASDNISWGFWGADFSGSVVQEYASAWIGIDEDIDAKITNITTQFGTATASFTGTMLGTLSDSSNNSTVLIDSNSSTISLNFDFGNSTTTVSTTINGDSFNSGINAAGNLSISATPADTYTIENGANVIKGSFYGTNGSKTIGSFNLYEGTKQATGVYKASN
jgi:hypothetical protein